MEHYRVAWSAPDGEFVATCTEFPSLSWLAPTQVEALEGARLLIADVVSDIYTAGQDRVH